MKRPVGQLEEWEWIDLYWSGKLSREEKEFFEQEMDRDEAFAMEAESLRDGIKLFEEARHEVNIRKTLEGLKKQSNRQWIVTRMLTFSGSVAAAACVAFAFFLSYATVKTPDAENDLRILRDLRPKYRTDSTNNLALNKKQAFDLFFEGQSYLAEGRAELAQLRFESVLKYPNLRPYFREAAQWHLVICYLRTNQLHKANAAYAALRNTREYEIPTMENWKVWWHLKRAELSGDL